MLENVKPMLQTIKQIKAKHLLLLVFFLHKTSICLIFCIISKCLFYSKHGQNKVSEKHECTYHDTDHVKNVCNIKSERSYI